METDGKQATVAVSNSIVCTTGPSSVDISSAAALNTVVHTAGPSSMAVSSASALNNIVHTTGVSSLDISSAAIKSEDCDTTTPKRTSTCLELSNVHQNKRASDDHPESEKKKHSSARCLYDKEDCVHGANENSKCDRTSASCVHSVCENNCVSESDNMHNNVSVTSTPAVKTNNTSIQQQHPGVGQKSHCDTSQSFGAGQGKTLKEQTLSSSCETDCNKAQDLPVTGQQCTPNSKSKKGYLKAVTEKPLSMHMSPLKKKAGAHLSSPDYLVPFQYGWKRELVHRATGNSARSDVYYHPPKGKKLRSTVDVEKYLARNNIFTLSKKNFTFYQASLDTNNTEWEVIRTADSSQQFYCNEPTEAKPTNLTKKPAGTKSKYLPTKKPKLHEHLSASPDLSASHTSAELSSVIPRPQKLYLPDISSQPQNTNQSISFQVQNVLSPQLYNLSQQTNFFVPFHIAQNILPKQLPVTSTAPNTILPNSLSTVNSFTGHQLSSGSVLTTLPSTMQPDSNQKPGTSSCLQQNSAADSELNVNQTSMSLCKHATTVLSSPKTFQMWKKSDCSEYAKMKTGVPGLKQTGITVCKKAFSVEAVRSATSITQVPSLPTSSSLWEACTEPYLQTNTSDSEVNDAELNQSPSTVKSSGILFGSTDIASSCQKSQNECHLPVPVVTTSSSSHKEAPKIDNQSSCNTPYVQKSATSTGVCISQGHSVSGPVSVPAAGSYPLVINGSNCTNSLQQPLQVKPWSVHSLHVSTDSISTEVSFSAEKSQANLASDMSSSKTSTSVNRDAPVGNCSTQNLKTEDEFMRKRDQISSPLSQFQPPDVDSVAESSSSSTAIVMPTTTKQNNYVSELSSGADSKEEAVVKEVLTDLKQKTTAPITVTPTSPSFSLSNSELGAPVPSLGKLSDILSILLSPCTNSGSKKCKTKVDTPQHGMETDCESLEMVSTSSAGTESKLAVSFLAPTDTAPHNSEVSVPVPRTTSIPFSRQSLSTAKSPVMFTGRLTDFASTLFQQFATSHVTPAAETIPTRMEEPPVVLEPDTLSGTQEDMQGMKLDTQTSVNTNPLGSGGPHLCHSVTVDTESSCLEMSSELKCNKVVSDHSQVRKSSISGCAEEVPDHTRTDDTAGSEKDPEMETRPLLQQPGTTAIQTTGSAGQNSVPKKTTIRVRPLHTMLPSTVQNQDRMSRLKEHPYLIPPSPKSSAGSTELEALKSHSQGNVGTQTVPGYERVQPHSGEVLTAGTSIITTVHDNSCSPQGHTSSHPTYMSATLNTVQSASIFQTPTTAPSRSGQSSEKRLPDTNSGVADLGGKPAGIKAGSVRRKLSDADTQLAEQAGSYHTTIVEKQTTDRTNLAPGSVAAANPSDAYRDKRKIFTTDSVIMKQNKISGARVGHRKDTQLENGADNVSHKEGRQQVRQDHVDLDISKKASTSAGTLPSSVSISQANLQQAANQTTVSATGYHHSLPQLVQKTAKDSLHKNKRMKNTPYVAVNLYEKAAKQNQVFTFPDHFTPVQSMQAKTPAVRTESETCENASLVAAPAAVTVVNQMTIPSITGGTSGISITISYTLPTDVTLSTSASNKIMPPSVSENGSSVSSIQSASCVTSVSHCDGKKISKQKFPTPQTEASSSVSKPQSSPVLSTIPSTVTSQNMVPGSSKTLPIAPSSAKAQSTSVAILRVHPLPFVPSVTPSHTDAPIALSDTLVNKPVTLHSRCKPSVMKLPPEVRPTIQATNMCVVPTKTWSTLTTTAAAAVTAMSSSTRTLANIQTPLNNTGNRTAVSQLKPVLISQIAPAAAVSITQQSGQTECTGGTMIPCQSIPPGDTVLTHAMSANVPAVVTQQSILIPTNKNFFSLPGYSQPPLATVSPVSTVSTNMPILQRQVAAIVPTNVQVSQTQVASVVPADMVTSLTKKAVSAPISMPTSLIQTTLPFPINMPTPVAPTTVRFPTSTPGLLYQAAETAHANLKTLTPATLPVPTILANTLTRVAQMPSKEAAFHTVWPVPVTCSVGSISTNQITVNTSVSSTVNQITPVHSGPTAVCPCPVSSSQSGDSGNILQPDSFHPVIVTVASLFQGNLSRSLTTVAKSWEAATPTASAVAGGSEDRAMNVSILASALENNSCPARSVEAAVTASAVEEPEIVILGEMKSTDRKKVIDEIDLCGGSEDEENKRKAFTKSSKSKKSKSKTARVRLKTKPALHTAKAKKVKPSKIPQSITMYQQCDKCKNFYYAVCSWPNKKSSLPRGTNFHCPKYPNCIQVVTPVSGSLFSMPSQGVESTGISSAQTSSTTCQVPPVMAGAPNMNNPDMFGTSQLSTCPVATSSSTCNTMTWSTSNSDNRPCVPAVLTTSDSKHNTPALGACRTSSAVTNDMATGATNTSMSQYSVPGDDINLSSRSMQRDKVDETGKKDLLHKNNTYDLGISSSNLPSFTLPTYSEALLLATQHQFRSEPTARNGCFHAQEVSLPSQNTAEYPLVSSNSTAPVSPQYRKPPLPPLVRVIPISRSKNV